MTTDQFDALVDDASHAVNNVIPDRVLDMLGGTGRSNLLVQINDALTPILRDVIDQTGSDFGNPTRVRTIAAMVYELIQTHITKCDEGGELLEDRPPHVISEELGTGANIDSLAICDVEAGTQIYLVLDDSSAFSITVQAVPA